MDVHSDTAEQELLPKLQLFHKKFNYNCSICIERNKNPGEKNKPVQKIANKLLKWFQFLSPLVIF